MPMPKSGDPKVSISIRVRRSLLEAYQAKGDDWRERMHAALEAAARPAEEIGQKPKATKEERPKTAPKEIGPGRRVTDETITTYEVQIGPSPFTPRLKGLQKGKAK